MKRRSQNEMKHRIGISLILILLVSMGLLTGCVSKSAESLNFLNYGENIDQATLEAFTKETGIKVNVDTFDDMETMYQKLSKSSAVYDVVLVSDALMPRMIEEKLVQALQKKEIPNLDQIDPLYLNLEMDQDNVYSVPYMFGTVGIVYNKTYVKEPVDSWASLWNEEYKGRVFMFDTYRDTFGAALKQLGYSLNETDPKAIQEAMDLLIEQREKVNPIYGVDNGTVLIPAGETYINMIWSGEGLNLQAENPDLVYIVPKEGANFWIDSLCVAAKSENTKAAHAFINYVTEKESALRIAEEIGFTTPNKLARALQPDEVKNNPNAYMSAEVMARCELYTDFPDDVKEAYFKAWNKLKEPLDKN